MEETSLLKKGGDLIVCAKEVTYKDAFKEFPKHLFEDRGCPRWRDDVVGRLYPFTGEAPEPIGLTQDPPSCLIYMKEGTGLCKYFKVFIPG